MIVWLIHDRLAKASHHDTMLVPAAWVYVAEDLVYAQAKLSDSHTRSERQREEFKKAVDLVLASMERMPVVVTCVSGVSRSVTVACVAGAIYEHTTFLHQFNKVLAQDKKVFNPSPLWGLAAEMYPYLFPTERA